MLRRFSCGHPSHNSVHTRPAFALSFQEQFLLVRHMTQSRAERGAGDKHTSSFTCSPASQGATLLSSGRTRISFELGFFDTIIQRSRLTALLDSTPFSSSSLTATSWCFERKYWVEGHRVEHSGQIFCAEGSTPFPMSDFFSCNRTFFRRKEVAQIFIFHIEGPAPEAVPPVRLLD